MIAVVKIGKNSEILFWGGLHAKPLREQRRKRVNDRYFSCFVLRKVSRRAESGANDATFSVKLELRTPSALSAPPRPLREISSN